MRECGGSGYADGRQHGQNAPFVVYSLSNAGQPNAEVGWIDDGDNEEHIVQALSDLGIKHGLVAAADIHSAVAEHDLPGPSAMAVARADERRFGFLYRRKE